MIKNRFRTKIVSFLQRKSLFEHHTPFLNRFFLCMYAKTKTYPLSNFIHKTILFRHFYDMYHNYLNLVYHETVSLIGNKD